MLYRNPGRPKSRTADDCPKCPPDPETRKRLAAAAKTHPRYLRRTKEPEYRALRLGCDDVADEEMPRTVSANSGVTERPTTVTDRRAVAGRAPAGIPELL